MTRHRPFEPAIKARLYTRHNIDIFDPYMERVLEQLPKSWTDRERRLFYWIHARPVPLTLKIAGMAYGLSAERTRQIAASGFRRLQRLKKQPPPGCDQSLLQIVRAHSRATGTTMSAVSKVLLAGLHTAEFV